MNEGWACPRCGKVHAPFVMHCDCHQPRPPQYQCYHKWVQTTGGMKCELCGEKLTANNT